MRAITAAVLGLALALGGTATASADDTRKVDRGEYAAVHVGDTLAEVAKVFGARGSEDFKYVDGGVGAQMRTWDVTESDDGFVTLVFERKAGYWVVTDKMALWHLTPKQTADTMTKREYRSVTKGMTLAQVRKIAGTSGTLCMETGGRVLGRMKAVAWPVYPSSEGGAIMMFEWSKGAYRLTSKEVDWDGTSDLFEGL